MHKTRIDSEKNELQSGMDRLLAEAHDFHLTADTSSGTAKLQVRKSHSLRSDIWQRAFSALEGEGLIHECVSSSHGGAAPCRAIFSPTSAGLDRLRELALASDQSVLLTQARWNEEPNHLSWQDTLSAWDSYQGEILGDIEGLSGKIESEGLVVAETGFYRLNTAVAYSKGFELSDLIDEHPSLQAYQGLVRGKAGEVLSLRDIPQAFGISGEGALSVIILDRLKISAQFIGLGLGAQILRRLFLRYGQGGGVCVISPLPLQFGRHADRVRDQAAYKAAEESLRRYYGRMGFIPHPYDSTLMACSLLGGPLSWLRI